MMTKFLTEDLKQIKNHRLTPEKVENDLKKFEEGFGTINISRPATINDGILTLDANQLKHFIDVYNNSTLSRCKFVPASGAATRMFKDLHNLLKAYDDKKSLVENLILQGLEQWHSFFENLSRLPFAKSICNQLNLTEEDLHHDEHKVEFITYALDENGLHLSQTPKALIPFHTYQDKCLTAFEEHLYEAAAYAKHQQTAKLHFTISEEHQSKFDAVLNEIINELEAETNVKFEVDFSYQSNSTDTIAINLDYSLYRDKNGKLLFRPAGHGALLENLNQLTTDLIFIKNIDNVCYNPEQQTQQTNNDYKKALAGLCISFKTKINHFCKALNQHPNQEVIREAKQFLNDSFNLNISTENPEELISILDKPLRVCGMVKNEGDPGGGPFWVQFKNGDEKLQIVEKSQINLDCSKQTKHFEDSTHFNPVDIVCSIKNAEGKTFNLQDFVDDNQGFIANKSVDGHPIKGLELPGLWNGGMAHWHTLFVEVPQQSFNPVKSIADLLKPHHQECVEVQ